VRTLIVSDLHLGGAAHADVLRRPQPRAALFAALRDVDRLVLLGDVLELRHGPRREALAVAREFFSELGREFAGREVVVSAGNHDHALVEPWLARRSEQDAPAPIAAEQRLTAADCSSMMARLADWCEPARLTAAYPGLWVRPDVYATHGHYLDCHMTVPTIECLSIAAMARVLRRPPSSFACAEDYEAVLGPVYAWLDAVARQAPVGNASNGQTTVRAWRALNGRGRAGGVGAGRARLARTRSKLAVRTIGAAFPVAVAALNRAGLGPFRADISSDELRRSGLRAMGEVAQRLELGDAYVVFGHTHRAGPLPTDREPLWVAPGGARLFNAGCWSYDGHFLTSTPGESPYWPGGCVIVEDSGPPLFKRLLADQTHAELAPPGR
jgi:Calcineurin-like phosphoesterase